MVMLSAPLLPRSDRAAVPVRVFVLAPGAGEEPGCDLPDDLVTLDHFADAAALLAALRRQPPDLVLLRHRPRDREVLEVLRAIRAVSQLPCVLYPAGGDDPELRVLGFEAGADDCLPASATPREIVSRIRAVLRRAAPRPAPAMNGWQLSAARRDLYLPDGEPCGLTAAEFKLLDLLIRSRQAVSRDELSLLVCRRAYSPGDRAVDGLVARVRRKLEREGEEPVIKAVRGIGYAFAGFPHRPAAGEGPGLCRECGILQHNLRLGFVP